MDNRKEKFLEKAYIKHGNKFKYNNVVYVNNNTLVNINCPIHGMFDIRPSVHLNSDTGCQGCSKDLNFDKLRIKASLLFISKASKKFPSFDYTKVNYINNSTPVTIGCSIHGEFQQEPYVHLISKYGCSTCSNNIPKRKSHSIEKIIDKANSIHNFTYDYTLVNTKEYKNTRQLVDIKCENGHIFKQSFHDHIISENGCPVCAKPCFDTESFVKLSLDKHCGKYSYKKVVYTTQKENVIITCPVHGDFTQAPTNHLFLGRGCPNCKTSKGEVIIKNFLETYGLIYYSQKTFNGCKYKKLLRFDFFIPDYNICIEFDGIQHFKPVERFGGIAAYEELIKKDSIKNEFCVMNNIKLIRISDISKINEILKSIFNIKTNAAPIQD